MLKSFLFFASALFSLFSSTPLRSEDYLSVASGVYDLIRTKHRTCEFELEYKCLVSWLPSPIECIDFRPLLGAMATVKGSGYLYGGINFDIHLGKRLYFAPGFAAGYYWPGDGKNLGFPLEFRSGVELGWCSEDGYRFGVHFYHLSNASLGSKNPGEESLVFFYDIPISRIIKYFRKY